MSEECKERIDAHEGKLERHGEEIAVHRTKIETTADQIKAMEARKVDRQEMEPLTWQVRSLLLSAIGFMGSLALYVLTRAKL